MGDEKATTSVKKDDPSLHRHADHKPLAASCDEHVAPLGIAQIISSDAAVVHTRMHEVAVTKIQTGVADLAALVVPEVKAIAWLEVFELLDLLTNLSLFSRGSRKLLADLAKKLLDEGATVDAGF